MEAASLAEALSFLERCRVDVVVAEGQFAGGSWRVLLDGLRRISASIPLIATSRLADEHLWAQVLNEGGFDVLAQPFDREEVIRVIEAATRRVENDSQRLLPKAAGFGALL